MFATVDIGIQIQICSKIVLSAFQDLIFKNLKPWDLDCQFDWIESPPRGGPISGCFHERVARLTEEGRPSSMSLTLLY